MLKGFSLFAPNAASYTPLDLMEETLSQFSAKDIKSIKKRVEFYLVHYDKVKNISKDARKDNTKLIFLENFNKILETEIKNRA